MTRDPRYDTNGVRRPNVQVGMAERTRLDGSRFLLGTVAEQLTIAPGSTLRLERIARTEGDAVAGCTFALVIAPPVESWQPTAKQLAGCVRLDGCALRQRAEQEHP